MVENNNTLNNLTEEGLIREEGNIMEQNEVISSFDGDGFYKSGTIYGKSLVNEITEDSEREVAVIEPCEGSNITLEGTSDGYINSAILKGRTLVNIAPVKKTLANLQWSQLTDEGAVKFNYNLTKLLQTGKTYLFRYVNAPTKFKDFYWTGLGIGYTKNNEKFTVTSEITSEHEGNFYLRTTSAFTNDELQNIQLLIIEYQDGMEKWDIPYFEGMKSVNTPVLTTTGKNLFDVNKSLFNVNGEVIGDSGSSSYFKSIFTNQDGGSANRVDVKKLLFLKKGDYFISGVISKNVLNLYCYDLEGVYLNVNARLNNKFTLVQDCYIDLLVGSPNEFEFSNIQIEHGTTKTQYEPFKSNILMPTEEVELHGNIDAKDTLNVVTGEIINHFSDPIILTGDEKWEEFEIGGNKQFYIQSDELDIFIDNQSTVNVVCDTYRQVPYSARGFECFDSCFVNRNAISILKNPTMTLTEFKTELQEKNVTVRGVLREPSVKTVNLTNVDQDGNITNNPVATFDNITHISTSSEGLIPTLTLGETKYTTKVEPNKEYTLVCEYSAIEDAEPLVASISGLSINIENNKTLFTTPESLSNKDLVFSGKGNSVEKVMVLEGNHLEDEVGFFNGIGSCESPTITSGGIVNNYDGVILGANGEVIDTLDVIYGTVTNNTKKILLNGTEEWELHSSGDGTYNFMTILEDSVDGEVLCDKLNHSDIYCEGGFLHIVTSEDDIKSWLNDNPIHVRYSLSEPLVTTVDEFIAPRANGVTTVSSSNGLAPTFEFNINEEPIMAVPVNTDKTLPDYIKESLNGDNLNHPIIYGKSSVNLAVVDELTVKENKYGFIKLSKDMLIDGEEYSIKVTRLPNKPNMGYKLVSGYESSYEKLFAHDGVDSFTYDSNFNGDLVVQVTNKVDTISLDDVAKVEVAIYKPYSYDDSKFNSGISPIIDPIVKNGDMMISANRNMLKDIEFMDGYIENDGSVTGSGARAMFSGFIEVDKTFGYLLGTENIVVAHSPSSVLGWHTTPRFYNANKIVIPSKDSLNTFNRSDNTFKLDRETLEENNVKFIRFYTTQLMDAGSYATLYKEGDRMVTVGELNGVRDELHLDKSQDNLIKRVGKLELMGDEPWTINRSSESHIEFCLHIPGMDRNNIVASNRFTYREVSSQDTLDLEYITVRNGLVYINVAKSRLSTVDVTGFNDWCESNIVDIHYVLETAIVESVHIDRTPTKENKLTLRSGMNHIKTMAKGLRPKLSIANKFKTRIVPNSKYTVIADTEGEVKVNIGGGDVALVNGRAILTSADSMNKPDMKVKGNVKDIMILQGVHLDTEVNYFEGVSTVVEPSLLVNGVNEVSVPEGLELQSIDNVRDELDFAKSEGNLIKRIRTVKFDGDLNVTWNKAREDEHIILFYTTNIVGKYGNPLLGECISEHFTSGYKSLANTGDYECCYTNNGHLNVIIDKDKASTSEELNAYLNANNVTFSFQDTNPRISTVDLTGETIKSVDGTTSLELTTNNNQDDKVFVGNYYETRSAANTDYTVIVTCDGTISASLGGKSVELTNGKGIVRAASNNARLVLSGENTSVKDIMVIKGHYLDKEIEYFEGMENIVEPRLNVSNGSDAYVLTTPSNTELLSHYSFIDMSTGKLHEDYVKVTLDGSESWIVNTIADRYNNKFELSLPADYNFNSAAIEAYCEGFTFYNTNVIPPVNGFSAYSLSQCRLIFNPDTNLIPLDDLARWKNWLASNPLTLIYRKYNGRVMDIETSKPLNTLNGKTIINSSTDGLAPYVEIKPSALPVEPLSPNTTYTVSMKQDRKSSAALLVNLGGSVANVIDGRAIVVTPSTITSNEVALLGRGNSVKELTVIKGDLSNTQLPYFEGISNVGFNALKTVGANLFRTDLMEEVKTAPDTYGKSIGYTLDELCPGLESGTVYKMHFDYEYNGQITSGLTHFACTIPGTSNTTYLSDIRGFVYTEELGVCPVSCYGGVGITSGRMYNLQMFKGVDRPAKYVPYISTRLESNEVITLNSFNGKRDELNPFLTENNLTRYSKMMTIGEIVKYYTDNNLSITPEFWDDTKTHCTISFREFETMLKSTPYTDKVICDRYPYSINCHGGLATDPDIFVGTTNDKHLRVMIRKSLIGEMTPENTMVWFYENIDQDAVIQFGLKTPEVSTVDLRGTLATNDGFTYITSDTDGLIPEIEIDVPNAKETILDVIDSLRTDYMGEVHDTVQDAIASNVEMTMGELHTVRYEGDTFTATNTQARRVKDAVIYGNTLVNLIQHNLFKTSDGYKGAAVFTSGNGLTVDWSKGIPYNTWVHTNDYNKTNIFNGMVKPDTDYTLILNVLENNPTFEGGSVEGVSCSIHLHGMEGYRNINTAISSGKTGMIACKYNFSSLDESVTCESIGFRIYGTNQDGTKTIDGGRLRISPDMMLIEGDWTNRELPKFFKGMSNVKAKSITVSNAPMIFGKGGRIK